MNNIENTITSIANEKAKRIRALAQKKNRDAEKVFVVEGAEHLQKALANGWQVETLLHIDSKPVPQEILRLCKAQNTAIYAVNEKVASYATNRDNAQALVGVVRQRYQQIGVAAQAKTGVWLGLENVRDSGNLGSIIRSADAVAVQGILLIGNCCDAFAPEVIRATTGSFSAVPLVRISTIDFVNWRSSFAGKIIGTHLHEKAVDYRQAKLAQPVIILMGGEQAGLSAELTAVCDVLVKIPMREGVESLNLAVSTAIIIYELVKH